MNNDSDIEIDLEEIIWNNEKYYLAEEVRRVYTIDIINKYDDEYSYGGEVNNDTIEDYKWTKLYIEYIKYRLYKNLIWEWKLQSMIKSANIISNHFLECKYNPKYKYCRDRMNKMYDEEFN